MDVALSTPRGCRACLPSGLIPQVAQMASMNRGFSGWSEEEKTKVPPTREKYNSEIQKKL